LGAGMRSNCSLSLTSCCADAAPPAPGLEPCSRAAMNDMAQASGVWDGATEG